MNKSDRTIIIIPGYSTSTVEIVFYPNGDKVTVMELFCYGMFEYAGVEGEDDHLPSHMVNNVWESPASVEEVIADLRAIEFIGREVDELDPMKCIVHARHLLDEEPIVCPNLSAAFAVAKAFVNQKA